MKIFQLGTKVVNQLTVLVERFISDFQGFYTGMSTQDTLS